MRKWILIWLGCCLFGWAVAQEAKVKRSVSRFVSLLTYIDEESVSDIADEFKRSGEFVANGERTTLVAFLEQYKRYLNGIPTTHLLTLDSDLEHLLDCGDKQYYRVSGTLRRYRSDMEIVQPYISEEKVWFLVRYNGSKQPVTLMGCQIPFLRSQSSPAMVRVTKRVPRQTAVPPRRVDWVAFKDHQGLGKLLKSRMDLFCQYVAQVGTTSLSEEQKDLIIGQGVPGLFFRFREDPRMMITSVGDRGAKRVRKPIEAYFENLKLQARKGIFVKRVYKLNNCFSSGKLSDLPALEFLKRYSDGSLLYRTYSEYEQVMYDVNVYQGVESQVIRHERDRKRMEMYILVKTNKSIGVYLGDVVEVKRIN